MSNRKLAKAIQGFFRALRRLHQTVTKGLVNWLLRSALKNNRGNRLASGFVLPTTVLLGLVVTLTVGALTYRAYNRNAQVIGQNQQRIIYNAATPAIDRARSKLEFLFDATKDNRYPGGVPSEGRLLSMLLNDTKDSTNTKDFAQYLVGGVDPYKLPDEERVDLNVDGRKDNAWSFRTDTNGDGTADATVIYSVIFSTPTDAAKNPQELLLTLKDSEKVKQLVVRHGPLSKESSAVKCGSGAGGAEGGWFEDQGGNTSILRKNFQVDAMVIPDQANSTAVTLEFHQDRQLNRGNKWGAWFRNDLEIFPGPTFNWNGAMHTEGSLMIGGTEGKKFTAHLISSPSSCLFSPADNSGITVTDVPSEFKGSLIAGMMGSSNADGKSDIYIYGTNPTSLELNVNTDTTPNTSTPNDVSIDPTTLLVADKYAYRPDKTTGSTDNWKSFETTGLAKRITSKGQDKPYVDDLYRADDRWGPKPKYGTGDSARSVPDGEMGKEIPGTAENLILTLQDDNSVGSEGAGVGLDGYWERRARGKGVRILVGERLELGNLNTWVTPRDQSGDDYVSNNPNNMDVGKTDEREGDPLYPPTVAPYPIGRNDSLTHLDLQRRTLRDNPSAVQATAVYHAAKDKDYPVACLTSTVHPGTLSTLYQSINFLPTRFADGATGAVSPLLQSNFFTGQGTNGWEFSAPSGSATAFANAMNSSTSPLRTALQNLANFAGDPNGVFPLKPTADTFVHPYPALTMWGNYSNLRRVLGKLTAGTTYANLSIADKTYLQTASCTIGVLAYNIDQIQKFDPLNVNNDYSLGNGTTVLEELAISLQSLMNSEESDGEVLPRGQLKSRDYSTSSSKTGNGGGLDTDYFTPPPEAWIGALKQQVLKGKLTSGSSYEKALAETLNDPKVRMAELIMLKYQIRRDRAFGFRSSPAFGTYVGRASGTNVDTSRRKYRLPSACDPDEFKFANLSTALGQTSGPSVRLGEYRLALSRLCGALDTTNYNPDDPTKRAWVLPKFPALYYIFPEINHDLDGELEAGTPLYDHRQPGATLKSAVAAAATTDIIKSDSRAEIDEEPYVKNRYVAGASVNGSVTFRVVGTSTLPSTSTYSATLLPLTPTEAAADNDTKNYPSRYPYAGTTPFPVADYALGSAIALTPRPLDDWQLPYTAPKTISTSPVSGGPNVSPNIIVSTDGTTKVAVPFLDRAFFDGRQVMLMRSLDIDLGMLRSSRPIGTTDVWLPESGIIYAFREDAIREDAIVRPTGTDMDLRNPAIPTDPPFVSGISPKVVDFKPDPERRVHGFRLRNGSELKRKDSLIETAKNIRGLSFFTDQPVFIQGDFNLHQDGAEDAAGTRLEEFTAAQRLPDDTDYSAGQFYGRTATNYDNFSVASKDRWRPSEVLADSIGILSNNFCDGSIADTFVIPDLTSRTTYPVADFRLFASDQPDLRGNPRAQYNNGSFGLFSPGCTGNGYTSFHNRNLPQYALPSNGGSWDWVRETSSDATLPQRDTNPAFNYWPDFTSPVKISRAGQPLIQRPQLPNPPGNGKPPLRRPVSYGATFNRDPYYPIGDPTGGSKKLTPAIQTRVNSIVVSGIVPSRTSQSYGGLHNFPRFLEAWDSTPLNFAGSFLQLSFSNYSTGPFESEAWEIGQVADSTSQNLGYYTAPKRLWGYDVGLQLSPAGPAATRFVTSSKSRNEFYNEPPVNDPYISMLCKAAKTITDKKFGPSDPAKVNCPS